MTVRPLFLGAVLAALALSGCGEKAADKTATAQGAAPEGTISDELPDMDLLPNDAPLADPSDLPPVPGAVAPTAPAGGVAPSDETEAPVAARPAEPTLEGSIAQ